MALPDIKTNPEELLKFHTILMKYAPNGYLPFYFVLEIGGKEPKAGISWKKNRKSFEQAIKLMEKGYNIGIAGTDTDSLCIMDVDDMSQVPFDQIKPTLQITSRKRIGRHYYYFSLDGSAKKNIPTGDAGEIRSVWYYVLAPGSYVSCDAEDIEAMPEEERQYAGRYTIAVEKPLSEITYDEFPDVYKRRYEEKKRDDISKALRSVNKQIRKPVSPARKEGKLMSALWELDVGDVSGIGNTGGKRVPMPLEMHSSGSKTGHNCSVDNGKLTCWRHYTVHNAFSYLAVLAGILPCERAGKEHGSSYFGVDMCDGETVYKVWSYAKLHGFIPEDDPIPWSALAYYAISKKVCAKKDIVDGKIPKVFSIVALMIAKKEGLNFGRVW